MAQSLNRCCCPEKPAQASNLRTAVQIRNSHLNPRPHAIVIRWWECPVVIGSQTQSGAPRDALRYHVRYHEGGIFGFYRLKMYL